MERTFIVLFSIATFVAIAVSRTRVPYTVALVVVGLVAGALHVVEPPHLTKELLFSLFLPGLIFEAAYNLHISDLRRTWRTVATLAGPGVIAAIGITALVATWAVPTLGLDPTFTWQDGLLLGALVSATDPVAVVSLFRKLGVPSRLTTIVEAESLFNDGTSIVALTLILAYVQGTSNSIGGLFVQFVVVVFGGGAIGGIIAYAIVRLTRRVNDPMIEIALTTIAAYGSFVLAESFHLSGVIATVVAGLMLGTSSREATFTTETRITADAFWQYIAFALNSIVFLLIGFEVQPRALLGSAAIIAVSFGVVMLARLGVVYSVTGVMWRTTERVPQSWALLITWGGLRGALAMVLALALPADYPHQTLLIDLTFGIVTVSLLLQGLTIPKVAERLVADSQAGVSAT